jgi:predicted DNA-binding protein with PD1-like motif
MKFSEARMGRVFVIRLQDGDIIHEAIEKFAVDQSICRAVMVILGGADNGSHIVVGPQHDVVMPISPMETLLEHAHEVTGTGTLFPDENGRAILHMHIACGRDTHTITGCVRNGVKTWHVLEIILFELLSNSAVRVYDPEANYRFLEP